jgi:hypothetical protein
VLKAAKMREKISKIPNSHGETVASVYFEGGWMLSTEHDPPEEHGGFATEIEAFDYWHENFDPESGRRLRPDR